MRSEGTNSGDAAKIGLVLFRSLMLNQAAGEKAISRSLTLEIVAAACRRQAGILRVMMLYALRLRGQASSEF